MIIWRIQSLTNDHPEDSATCKWSFGGTGHLQMIIQRIWPLANDHPEDLASCKWSSGGTGLLQMIICHPRHPNHLSQDLNSISRTFLEQFALVISIWSDLFSQFSFSHLRISFHNYSSAATKQDKVNSADSAFIFLIIQSQNQWSGRRRWPCLVWSLLER